MLHEVAAVHLVLYLSLGNLERNFIRSVLHTVESIRHPPRLQCANETCAGVASYTGIEFFILLIIIAR